jgi:DNA-binding IclR family transcriptional regulator
LSRSNLKPEKSKAPAVDEAPNIMQALVQPTYPLSLTEIADRVNMPMTSRHWSRKSYCMGATLFQMASAAYLQQPIVPRFHSIADVFKNELHLALSLSVLVVAHVP